MGKGLTNRPSASVVTVRSPNPPTTASIRISVPSGAGVSPSGITTVPLIVPDVPILPRDPVVAYLPDLFTRPNPLRADVVVDVTARMDTIVQLLSCHQSQVFEWMPFNQGILDQVPDDDAGRLSWLRTWIEDWKRPFTERFRDRILDIYGPQQGQAIAYVEVLEISEYATPLDAPGKRRLFPFVP